MGNVGELRSILFNLIKNSIEAMPNGGSISIYANKDDTQVYVTIIDTGIGMTEDVRLRVFQPFFTTKGYEPGRGLGMSGVYTLIQEHHGSIEIKKTVPGKGTIVEIRFPFIKKTESVPKETAVEIHKNLSVLWVDDEPMIRKIGKNMIEILEHQVAVAANGKEAVELLEKQRFDLMITDLGMPEMNGEQLLNNIKGKYPDMQIVTLSGWGDVFSENNKREYGVTFTKCKPLQFSELTELLHQVSNNIKPHKETK